MQVMIPTAPKTVPLWIALERLLQDIAAGKVGATSLVANNSVG